MHTRKMGGKKVRYIIVAVMIFFLTGCATTNQVTPAVTVITEYPNLPPIEIPRMPPLRSFRFDIPRDTSVLTVKNTERCRSVPEEKRNENFWKMCGIHPPLENSNIYLGLDEENFNNLMQNLTILRERAIVLENLLKEVNRQREEWRKKNAESLERSRP